MKIVNEYLVISPITGEVNKYIEIEGEIFFRESVETNNIRYYWVPAGVFYEWYDNSKKLLEEWKQTK